MNDTEQDPHVLQSNAATTVELGRADELLEGLIDEALLESFQLMTLPAGFWVVNRLNAAPHQRNLRRKMI